MGPMIDREIGYNTIFPPNISPKVMKARTEMHCCPTSGAAPLEEPVVEGALELVDTGVAMGVDEL
jgi:hypothetical protein